MSDVTPQTPIYDVSDLASLGGVTRRTVRYYVQRGLLPAPTGTGRGKHYTEEHLRRLIQIRSWQESGADLMEIARRLSGDSECPPSPEPSDFDGGPAIWTRLVVTDGVELHLRGRVITRGQARDVCRAVLGVLGTLEGPESATVLEEREAVDDD